MNHRGMLGTLSLCVLALTALSIVVAGCAISTEPPAPRWEKVTSGRISGDQTAKQYLGTFYLVSEARLAWDLSGPIDAQAEFKLMVARNSDAHTIEGHGTSVRSWREDFAPRDTEALVVGGLDPGEYRVTLTQRLLRGQDAGYTGTFTLYTRVLD
jgi:hypothetical protein